MTTRSAAALLDLPVRTGDGVFLGRPVDVLLDMQGFRALGFSVQCGDGQDRFLPFAASEAADDGLVVRTALTLLEAGELVFYREHSTTLRVAAGALVVFGGGTTGTLVDVRLAADGAVTAFVVESPAGAVDVAPGSGVRVSLRRPSSA